MVHDHLWAAAGMGGEDGAGFLCIGCLEFRLGRELTAADFTDAMINMADDPWNTLRLRSRLERVE